MTEVVTTKAGWRTGVGISQDRQGQSPWQGAEHNLHSRHMGLLRLRTPGACWRRDGDGRGSCHGGLAHRRGCLPWHVGGRRAHGCLPAIASQNIIPLASMLHRGASSNGTAVLCLEDIACIVCLCHTQNLACMPWGGRLKLMPICNRILMLHAMHAEALMVASPWTSQGLTCCPSLAWVRARPCLCAERCKAQTESLCQANWAWQSPTDKRRVVK